MAMKDSSNLFYHLCLISDQTDSSCQSIFRYRKDVKISIVKVVELGNLLQDRYYAHDYCRKHNERLTVSKTELQLMYRYYTHSIVGVV